MSISKESIKSTRKVRLGNRKDIAIIGMACRFPGAKDYREFWQNLEKGATSIREIPEDRWDWKKYFGNPQIEANKTNCRWGGFINDVDRFDAGFFGISPREAELMDPQQRIFIEEVWRAIEDAGYKASDLAGTNTGVFVGVSAVDYNELLVKHGIEINAHSVTGWVHSILANRVSFLFNLHGPSEPIDTACSSSLVAIHRAVGAIRQGNCQMAIVGGVNIILSPRVSISFSKAGMLSKDGRCKAFDAKADGYVRAEGAGVILLKPLNMAIEDKDYIYGVIKSSAENHSGKTRSLTSPSAYAQSKLLIKAYKRAKISPDTLSYIEAHGTGTPLGDPIEIYGLKRSFAQLNKEFKVREKKEEYCGIGSVKANIGHLESAAGIAGVIKVLLSMQQKKIPATPNFLTLNPNIQLEGSPFYIVDKTKPWEKLDDEEGNPTPRRAGISSFGFGGSNAHVIIEEYENEASKSRIGKKKPELFVLSAKNKEKLMKYAKDILKFLKENPEKLALSDIAYTLQVGREELDERLAIIVSSITDLIIKLEKYCDYKNNIENFYSGRINSNGSNADLLCEKEEDEEYLKSITRRKKLDKLAQFWIHGQKIDWRLLYQETKAKRIPLPTYPFTRDRYWIPKIISEMDKEEVVASGSKRINYFQNLDSGKKNEMIEGLLLEDLTAIASILLKIEPYQLNPFEVLGGFGFNSIILTEFANKINRKYGTEITPAIFFEHSSLSSFKDFLIARYRDNIHKYYTENMKISATNGEELSKLSKKESRIISEHQNADEDTNLLKDAKPEQIEIAIIGMSGKMPQASALEVFWKNLEEGKDSISEIPKDRWDWKAYYGDPTKNGNKTNIKWGGFVEDVDKFDATFFGISPHEAELMDPRQRILLEEVWKAIEDAGYRASVFSGTKTGLFVGVSGFEYLELLVRNNNAIEAHSSTGVSHSILANRISYSLNLRGPSEVIDTACSSSLVVLHRAIQAIQARDCEMAVVGGVNVILSPWIYISLSKAGMLSEDGRCKTFDAGANGYVRGEGAGVIILKPLRRAQMDGDHIYGVIKGSAVNHGGHTNSLTAPNPKAQAELLINVYEKAKIGPETLSYIEAHGTGTKLGDPVEVNGLRIAFEELYKNKKFLKEQRKNYCGLGSVKTNIGHLEPAAGIAGIIKVLLSMKYKKLTGNIHFKELNPFIELEGSPFYILDKTKTWEKLEDEQGRSIPRRAGISSFGFGGTNAHVIIEEHEPEVQRIEQRKAQNQLFVLSAKNEERLKEYAKKILAYLKTNNSEIVLSNLIYTSQVGRESMDERLAIIVSNVEELEEKLKQYCDGHQDIDHLFKGNAKKDKAKSELIIKGRAGQEFMKIFINDEELAILARLWVNGAKIEWELLYSGQKPRRISMPTYPFAKERYWVTDGKIDNIKANEQPKLHPLIDNNESTFEGVKFKKVFGENEFYIRDHIVGKDRILPGVIFLEIARVAGNFANRTSSVEKLKRILWLKPIVIDGKLKEIHINLYPSGNKATYEVCSIGEGKEKSIYGQGEIEYELKDKRQEDRERVNLEEIIKRCGEKIGKIECYDLLRKRSINYGPSFRVIEELLYNDTEAIAKLKLPKYRSNELKEYLLHPALLDGAIQAGVVLLGSGEEIYLPFAAAAVEIRKDFSETCYSYVKLCGEDERGKRFEIKVVNESGELIVKIEDYLTRMVKQDFVPEASETIYYQFIWEKSEIEYNRNNKNRLDKVLIFNGINELADALKGQFEDNSQAISVRIGKNFNCLRNQNYEINPENERDYRDLIDKLKKEGQLPTKIVYLLSESHKENDESNGEILKRKLSRGIYPIFYLTKALMEARPREKVEILYIYERGENKYQPYNSAMSGFARSVGIENPNIVVRTIEIVNDERINNEELLNKIIREFGRVKETEVKYEKGDRYVKRLKEIDLKRKVKRYLPLRERGVYLLTGGAGGLGLIFAKYLARKCKARLVLIGRTGISKEKSEKFREIEKAGGEVEYFAADVSKYKEAEKVIAHAKERFGEINGIIHSAGVIRDAFIINKTKEEFDDVLAAKIYGTKNLDQVARNEGLDFFIVFSSLAAVMGNIGQADYAYANAYLNSFTEERENLRAKSERYGKSLSINWPFWEKGGMEIGEEKKKWLQNNIGILTLNNEKGLEAFENLWSCDVSEVVVIKGHREKLEKILGIDSNKNLTDINSPESTKGVNSSKGGLQRRIEKELIHMWSELLKIEENNLDVETNLSEYGVDSIMIMKLLNRLEEKYGNAGEPTAMFNNPTINSYACYLIDSGIIKDT